MQRFFSLLGILVFLFVKTEAGAQPLVADSSLLIMLNQRIDQAVVDRDTVWLKGVYGDDFVFSHGSGRVDSRESWLRSVAKGGFLLRQHDSVTVEGHGEVALLKGRLTVIKKNKEKTDHYFLKYIRLYAWRNERWQLLSHSTIFEQHE